LLFEISANSNDSYLGWTMEGGSLTHIFESGPTKDHFSSNF